MGRLQELVTTGYIWNSHEALHLILTWLWICLGGFVQFIAVCCHIRFQNYLSLQWKVLICLSSALLLGPAMIYVFCIGRILSFKLKLGKVSLAEKEVEKVINAALLFASQAKLAEIFVESIPQLTTQILMTSLKHDVNALTPLQMASVTSSTIAISLGISSYVVNAKGRFYSLKHSQMTSKLVLTLLAVLEIAFGSGICRFAAAFEYILPTGNGIYIGACTTPFVGLSFVLAVLPIIQDKFQLR